MQAENVACLADAEDTVITVSYTSSDAAASSESGSSESDDEAAVIATQASAKESAARSTPECSSQSDSQTSDSSLFGAADEQLPAYWQCMMKTPPAADAQAEPSAAAPDAPRKLPL